MESEMCQIGLFAARTMTTFKFRARTYRRAVLMFDGSYDCNVGSTYMWLVQQTCDASHRYGSRQLYSAPANPLTNILRKQTTIVTTLEFHYPQQPRSSTSALGKGQQCSVETFAIRAQIKECGSCDSSGLCPTPAMT